MRLPVNLFAGCSVLGIVKQSKWFSGSYGGSEDIDQFRAYYGLRIGPFLILWTRWKGKRGGR